MDCWLLKVKEISNEMIMISVLSLLFWVLP